MRVEARFPIETVLSNMAASSSITEFTESRFPTASSSFNGTETATASPSSPPWPAAGRASFSAPLVFDPITTSSGVSSSFMLPSITQTFLFNACDISPGTAPTSSSCCSPVVSSPPGFPAPAAVGFLFPSMSLLSPVASSRVLPAFFSPFSKAGTPFSTSMNSVSKPSSLDIVVVMCVMVVVMCVIPVGIPCMAALVELVGSVKCFLSVVDFMRENCFSAVQS
mmetsp:Transcript_20043/g.50553  ORF Transcript_20043/g.50553 Transcript_20043/m.50553 type:complete len:223 (-) Transcript_20043:1541-2209(-)